MELNEEQEAQAQKLADEVEGDPGMYFCTVLDQNTNNGVVELEELISKGNNIKLINRYQKVCALTDKMETDMVDSKTRYYVKDPRVLAMSNFLGDYNSPMQPYAQIFVIEADKYGLDWRLIASISGVESAFGNLIPSGSNNGWGWRGINGNANGWSMFENWEEAITYITERMAVGYGITRTPFDIESTYCPPCGANPAHLWANGVTRYMNELQYYVNNLENL